MTIHKVDIRHFCFSCRIKRSTDAALRLLLQPRNVPRSKLPTSITFHQSIRELHDTVERLALRCSFHPRLSEYNRHVIAIEPRQHVVVFENIVVDFPAAKLVNLIRARAYVTVGKREGEVRR